MHVRMPFRVSILEGWGGAGSWVGGEGGQEF